jgi:hypothetical protein
VRPPEFYVGVGMLVAVAMTLATFAVVIVMGTDPNLGSFVGTTAMGGSWVWKYRRRPAPAARQETE